MEFAFLTELALKRKLHPVASMTFLNAMTMCLSKYGSLSFHCCPFIRTFGEIFLFLTFTGVSMIAIFKDVVLQEWQEIKKITTSVFMQTPAMFLFEKYALKRNE